MKIINFNHTSGANTKPIALIMGYFETFHTGHIHLIQKAIKYSKDNKLVPCIMTFDKNPLSTITNKIKPEIFNFDERVKIIKKLNIDLILKINFNKCIMKMSATEFTDKLKKIFLNIKVIFCGEDFTYGKNKSGTPLDLKKNFNVKIIKLLKKNKVKISSNQIHHLFNKENIENINNYLFTNYFIDSKIISNLGYGKKIGFPTLNLFIKDDKIIPNDGIYYGKAYIKKDIYLAAIYVGNSPTIINAPKKSVECHLLNFDNDIKVNNIVLEFIKFLRCDKKFNTISELITAIKNDINCINHLFWKNNEKN